MGCNPDVFCIKKLHYLHLVKQNSVHILPGAARELALTARTIGAAEAKALGLVSEVFPDAAALHAAVEAVAASMAARSPLAITGTKRVLLHSRCLPKLGPQLMVSASRISWQVLLLGQSSLLCLSMLPSSTVHESDELGADVMATFAWPCGNCLCEG